jgi:hypothetical protein
MKDRWVGNSNTCYVVPPAVPNRCLGVSINGVCVPNTTSEKCQIYLEMKLVTISCPPSKPVACDLTTLGGDCGYLFQRPCGDPPDEGCETFWSIGDGNSAQAAIPQAKPSPTSDDAPCVFGKHGTVIHEPCDILNGEPLPVDPPEDSGINHDIDGIDYCEAGKVKPHCTPAITIDKTPLPPDSLAKSLADNGWRCVITPDGGHIACDKKVSSHK